MVATCPEMFALYFPERQSLHLRQRQGILCKILCFHGSDCEECHLLEIKNPVRTSQETHYFPATESCRYVKFVVFNNE
jgi:hypothetical protein